MVAKETQLQDLDLLCEGDDAQASGAFERLWATWRPKLFRYSLKFTKDVQDREDVLQEVSRKVFEKRRSLTARDANSWSGFLYTVTSNTALDLLAQRRRIDNRRITSADPDQDVTEPRFIPALEYDRVHAMDSDLFEMELAERILHLANVRWLELDPTLAPRTHERQLLAAQWYYLDHVSPAEIALILNAQRPPSEPQLTRELLDRWLEHQGVIRFVAFKDLYFDGDRLAWKVLGLEGEVSQDALDLAAQSASFREDMLSSVPDPWTVSQALVVVWYCRSVLGADDIQNRIDCPLSPVDLEATIVRIEQAMPFKSQAKNLIDTLQRSRVRVKTIGKRGLWQRLCFQYRCWDELPHKEIVKRVSEQASMFDFSVTEAVLNGWFSQHRLADKLLEDLVSEGEKAN